MHVYLQVSSYSGSTHCLVHPECRTRGLAGPARGYFLIQSKSSALSTPTHSKSAASALACCDRAELPIAIHNSTLRNPLVIFTLPKWSRIGCKIFSHNSFNFSICSALGLLLMPLRIAVSAFDKL